MPSSPSSAIDSDDPLDRSGEDGYDIRRRVTEQPSLFATEDLIIPPSITSIRKAVSAIHAVPVKPEMAHTLNTRRLFDACIIVAQYDMRQRSAAEVERIRKERISPMFTTRITDLARLAGATGKNYERLYSALDDLFEMVLRWNVLGEDSEVLWDMKAHLLSSLGHGRGQKRGQVCFSFDPAILDIVLEPSNWATLALNTKELGTAAAHALYQTAWRYIGTSAKVTAVLPTETWIALLVGPSKYVKVDKKTGEKTINYGEFKRRCLLDAIARVNDVQALTYTLELKEFRSGNRVSKLQFKFHPKQQIGLGLPVTWPQDVVDFLRSLGHSDSEIADMSQGHSQQTVAQSIIYLKKAETRLRAAGKRITSRKAYFAGILANMDSGAEDADLDAERIEAEVRAQEEERVAAERQERLRAEFSQHQAQVFASGLFSLPAQQRQELLDAFSQSDEGLKHRLLWERGWTEKNVGALTVLRLWLAAHREAELQALLPMPHDRQFESWLAWRLDQRG